jgi:hypothetical protein
VAVGLSNARRQDDRYRAGVDSLVSSPLYPENHVLGITVYLEPGFNHLLRLGVRGRTTRALTPIFCDSVFTWVAQPALS